MGRTRNEELHKIQDLGLIRDGADLAVVHDDGVAGHMAEAGRVARDPRIKDLGRIALGYAAGDHPGLGVPAVENHIHL